MTDLRLLDLSSANPAFAPFTYPRFRGWLDRTTSVGIAQLDWPQQLAVGAFVGTQAVGLALVGMNRTGPARLLSVMVAADKRREGIGSALQDAACSHAGEAGKTEIEAHFGEHKNRSAFRGLAAAQGWSEPTLLELRLASRADWPSRMPANWERFLARLRKQGFESTRWSDIDDADRERAFALVDEQTGVKIPFKDFEDFSDPGISIAIRRYGELVGYVLGETQEDLPYHHYTTGYVSQSLQKSGWLMAAIDDVSRRQEAIYGAASVAVYETVGNNPPMINFMKTRLRPISLWMNERYIVTKPLA